MANFYKFYYWEASRKDQHMDEAQIFIGLKAGEEKAFNMLFTLLYAQVRFYVEQITKNESEAEDITMQSLFKFWKKGADEFQSFPQIKSYIFKTARNTAFNFIKRSKIQHTHRQNLTYLATEADEILSETSLYKVEMLQALLAEIENLPEQCRETFKLVFIENMPRPKVAEKLNITLSTVHGHCANAKNRLRQIFSEKELMVLILLIDLCPN
jgi:RNA polymerase sigma factor (sigma-70 family)